MNLQRLLRMHTAKVVATTSLVAVSAVAVPAGCSGNAVTMGSSCGPGTIRSMGECVVALDANQESDVTVSGAADSSANLSDALEEGKGADGTGQSPDVLDAPVDDSPQQSETQPPYDAHAPDPCPTSNVFLDCDPNCTPSVLPTTCRTGTCTVGTPIDAPAGGGIPPTFRTAQSPGTDSNCATFCPSRGIVYGYKFNVQNAQAAFYVIVEPPWYVSAYNSSAPYCPAASLNPNHSSCLLLNPRQTGYNSEFIIVTNDPQAPARNVQLVSGSSCPP
jgi:hypothetical protein